MSPNVWDIFVYMCVDRNIGYFPLSRYFLLGTGYELIAVGRHRVSVCGSIAQQDPCYLTAARCMLWCPSDRERLG